MKSKGTIMAVFDLDGTLTTGRSVESSFICYLIKTRRLKARNILNALIHYFKNILHDPVEAVKRNKMYLKDIRAEDAQLWAEGFFKGRKDRLLSGRNLREVGSHKELGHKTVLISGVPEFLAKAMDILRLFDMPYTTGLEEKNGIYTGCISGPHYYGKAKAELVMRISEELGADLKVSFCYADSKNDIHMMSLFGNPVAVNPDRGLRKAAVKMRWRIIGS
jgi:HAD superfamily hydrolase (TIGR01490 family)